MEPIFQEIEISAVLVGGFLAKKIVKLLSEDRLLNFWNTNNRDKQNCKLF